MHATPTRILTPSQSVPVLVPIPPTPEQQTGKENHIAINVVHDKPVIARYSHPHSPNPSHISQFHSPKLSATTATHYAQALTQSISAHPLPTVLSPGMGNVNHFLRPMPIHNEPSVTQLLAEQPREIQYQSRNQDRDSTMAAATGVVSWRKGQGFKQWEKIRLESSEVRRKADVAQLCQFPLSLSPALPFLTPSFDSFLRSLL